MPFFSRRAHRASRHYLPTMILPFSHPKSEFDRLVMNFESLKRRIEKGPSMRAVFLLLLFVVGVSIGALFVVDVPAPTEQIVKVIPYDRYAR